MGKIYNDFTQHFLNDNKSSKTLQYSNNQN